MRLLHTSDWHLGRSFGAFSLLHDQQQMIDQIVSIARDAAVDLVVIAGDVFDRAIPPSEAVVLLRETLRALRATGAQVALISGNHDGAERIAAYDGLLEPGLHLAGGFSHAGRVVELEFPDGPLHLVLVPFLDPLMAPEGEQVAGESAAAEPDVDASGAVAVGHRRRPSHASVLAHRLATARAHIAGRRSVVVAHAFVAGASVSDSERELSVGGADHVPVDVFDGFSYVALGHLHRPQSIGRPMVRYSGTPLAYSFSETEPKSVTIIDLEMTGVPSVEVVALGACRGVATIEGSLRELLDQPQFATAQTRWVRARITDDGALLDPMARLRGRFPYAVELHRTAVGGGAAVAVGQVTGPRRTPLEAACDFWSASAGEPASSEVVQLLRSALTTAFTAGGADG
jgi:exonuclease SbcD